MNCFKIKRLLKGVLPILFILLIISTPQYALARAGGGGSGSGGGSGGGGGGRSSHYGGNTDRYSGRNDPISSIIMLSTFLCTSSAGIIIFKVKISKKKIKSVSVIKTLSKKDFNWDYNQMKSDIKEGFYKIQNAWMERNQDLAKEYMSERLYIRHRSKTEWMKVRKEKNILKNVKLKKITPIAVKDKDGLESDFVWVHIKAKARDYIINEETGQLIEGNKHIANHFEEYWKFIRSDRRWILDEIRQIDEINDLDFFDINISE